MVKLLPSYSSCASDCWNCSRCSVLTQADSAVVRTGQLSAMRLAGSAFSELQLGLAALRKKYQNLIPVQLLWKKILETERALFRCGTQPEASPTHKHLN